MLHYVVDQPKDKVVFHLVTSVKDFVFFIGINYVLAVLLQGHEELNLMPWFSKNFCLTEPFEKYQ